MCAEILPLAMPTLVQFGSTVHVQVRARGYTPKMGKGEGSIKSITWLGGTGEGCGMYCYMHLTVFYIGLS